MTCCSEPSGKILSPKKAVCRGCGFTWTFARQGKGRFKTKNEKWGPVWFCKDEYDRRWRFKDYDRHEVIGTRRRGNRTDYVVSCPKEQATFTIDEQNPPQDAYCPFCERSGLLGPMVKRWQVRREEDDD